MILSVLCAGSISWNIAISLDSNYEKYKHEKYDNTKHEIKDEKPHESKHEMEHEMDNNMEPSGDVSTIVSADDPIIGNVNSSITIVEFSDFECPFCESFYSDTLPQIKSEYIDTGKAKLIYRDFPLSFHQNAIPAHSAANCADMQGKFWQYHDILFDNQIKWSGMTSISFDDWLYERARETGLDLTLFDECMKLDDTMEEIWGDIDDAMKLGVSGTPTFFICQNDDCTKIVGAQPFDVFADIIE